MINALLFADGLLSVFHSERQACDQALLTFGREILSHLRGRDRLGGANSPRR